MINRATAGVDPNCDRITEKTPDRPGFFLSEEAAKSHLSEYPANYSEQWRIEERVIYTEPWIVNIWVAVPKQWPLPLSLADAYEKPT